ncbi:DUF1269 domain-containing protein [Streptomyces sp. CRN 30]|uniref:DUF1269 domain-containing protein n=1 Tax=Streptomyces sp. CRN 30 TaxID=3075613 RepID=UPI002A83227F|nr:DUF1269 domain-containing protein [Streptomyces sp. CRN 30]
MAATGPVQLLMVEFGPEAEFEGRIVEELGLLEANGQIRVLDILFVRKEPSGTLFSLDYQAEKMGDTIAALLGISGERVQGVREALPELDGGGAFGLTLSEVRDLGESLDPGAAAAFVLLEHVWARYLRKAIRDAGGVPVAEGFLTEEAMAPIAAALLAAAEQLGEPVGTTTLSHDKSGKGRRRT